MKEVFFGGEKGERAFFFFFFLQSSKVVRSGGSSGRLSGSDGRLNAEERVEGCKGKGDNDPGDVARELASDQTPLDDVFCCFCDLLEQADAPSEECLWGLSNDDLGAAVAELLEISGLSL